MYGPHVLVCVRARGAFKKKKEKRSVSTYDNILRAIVDIAVYPKQRRIERIVKLKDDELALPRVSSPKDLFSRNIFPLVGTFFPGNFPEIF